MKKIICSILVLQTTAMAATQPIVVSAESALKRGMDYSSEVKKAQAQVNEAVDNLDKARGALFPTINGKASYTNKQNPTTYSTASVSGFQNPNQQGYLVGADLTQPIYAGGAITSGLSYYKASAEIARQNYFDVKQTSALSVMTALYNLALAQQHLDASAQNRDILKAYYDITTRYESIGRSRRMDRLQAGVTYSLSLAEVEQYQNALVTAQITMKKALGETSDAPISTDFKLRLYQIENLELEKAYEEALKRNPVIRSAELQSEIVDYSKDIDLSQDMPSLNLVGSAGYNSPDQPSLFQSSSQYYSFGLNLVVPLFSGLTSISKRKIYEEKSYQAKRDLQIAKDNLRQSVATNLDSLRSSRAQLDIAERSVTEARHALDLANKGYTQGIVSNIEVRDSQSTRYQAENLFLNSQYSYLMALLNLRKTMGIDLEKVYEK